LDVRVRANQKCLRLSPNEDQLIPVMVSLKTKDLQTADGPKPGVDLICVIDRSGSMAGQKMALVKQTLNVLLDFLGENDRLCLIQFDDHAQRLNILNII